MCGAVQAISWDFIPLPASYKAADLSLFFASYCFLPFPCLYLADAFTALTVAEHVMRKKLTPAFVTDIAPTASNQIYWDEEQRGFGLLVLPSGEKRYVIQYRAGGRSRRLTFK